MARRIVLLPCPFCDADGEELEVIENEDPPYKTVRCNQCGSEGPTTRAQGSSGRSYARKRWNYRAFYTGQVRRLLEEYQYLLAQQPIRNPEDKWKREELVYSIRQCKRFE